MCLPPRVFFIITYYMKSFVKAILRIFFHNLYHPVVGPFLNDIGHNVNNANNGNQNFLLSFKYGYFGHPNFPLLFKDVNFDNVKSTLSYSFFPMSFKNGIKGSVVV